MANAIVSGLCVCWNCQRIMVGTNTPDLFHCNYCSFNNYKTSNELTGIALSWFSANIVTNVKDISVNYWSSNQAVSMFPVDNTVPVPKYPYTTAGIMMAEGVLTPGEQAEDQMEESDELSELPPDDESSR